MSTIQALNEIQQTVAELTDTFTRVHAIDANLDPRVGFIYIDPDMRYIAVPTSNRRMLDYYGGFEYVDPESVTVVGDWVFYDSMYDRERISRALDYALEKGEAA